MNATTDMSSVSTHRWEQWRSTSKDPAEHSQAWKQENTQKTEAWEWDIQSQSSGSTGVWRQTRTVDTKMEFHKMKSTSNQFLTKVCQFLHWVLGIKTVYATFGMEATKSKKLMWEPFMSSSMTAAIRFGLNYTENVEAYKKTNFEQVQNLFNVTKTLILEHSEEILNVKTIGSTSPAWTRLTLSHDKVTRWTKAKERVYTDSALCLGKMFHISSGRIHHVLFCCRIAWN